MMSEIRYYPDIKAASINNYKKFSNTYRYTRAEIYLIEVRGGKKFGVDFCLGLAMKIRQQNPDSKLALLCSEKNAAEALTLQEGLIDAVLPRGAALDYLASQIAALLLS